MEIPEEVRERAGHGSYVEMWGLDFPWDEQPEHVRERWRKIGCAALSAAGVGEMVEAIDVETLDAIATEIADGKDHDHSMRALGLRGIAKRQRAALSSFTGGAK
jgi:hypothetical protein